jgi:hypothetical protein
MQIMEPKNRLVESVADLKRVCKLAGTTLERIAAGKTILFMGA